MATAAYDEIADWYEYEFLARQHGDPVGIGHALRELLGEGTGTPTVLAFRARRG